jgi:hypothetical protein
VRPKVFFDLTDQCFSLQVSNWWWVYIRIKPKKRVPLHLFNFSKGGPKKRRPYDRPGHDLEGTILAF